MPGRLALGRPQLRDLAGSRGQRGRRLFVHGRQLGPAFVVSRHQFLDLAVLLLGAAGPGAGLLGGRAQPLDLLGRRPLAAAGRADLGAQPGEAIGAVRGVPGVLGDPALDRGQLRLGPGALRDRRAQPVAADGQPGQQALFLLAKLGGLPFELVRIPARPLRLRLGRQMTVPLHREAVRRTQPLGQRGQPEPGFLGPGQACRVLLRGRVQLGFAPAALGHAGLQRGPAGQDGGLVGLIRRQLRGQHHVVVGEQPQPRITQVGLDRGGPAGYLGLTAQWLEAPAQLGGEVDQPGQIGLHRLQLAERLLLAPAVLQDAGGLLDERTPRLGPGMQHGVELALPDDDVHLPAQTGIGQQFLNIQQTAAIAVDGVLALAGPEHQPADRDLGVFDGQRAVTVVDGQRHLGAAQRRARGGAGEHDVLHLAAA